MADLRLLKARNALADGFVSDAAELAGHLVSGVLDLARWAGMFAKMIAHGITAGFLLGRGAKTLDPKGAGIVSGLIDTQYGFAKGFVTDIHTGLTTGSPMSEAAIASRSGLYSGATVHSCEVGQSERFGITLPYYPTEGSPCGGNCRCFWDLTETETIITAKWIAIDDAGTCDVCQARGNAPEIGITKAA